MDPISVPLLAALAGGAGGELGRQTWAGLTALVRRPFARGEREASQTVGTGQAELDRLQQEPHNEVHAQALSTALAVRAAADAMFSADLQQWHEHARLVRTGDGEVHNTVSGGTQHGPVIQGRDFSGLSFTTSPPHPSGTDQVGQRSEGSTE
ncbi:hypothetical protein ACWD3J_06360 [Streptomyces sp. NPDC002755]|uniref:hypothetical protein n=1 Tax=Streptomyces sp. NPDC002884 TaxID=3154544 RepID=UPI00332F3979